MNIMAVDSSAVTASCAVVCGGRLTAQSFVNVGLTHSETLMTLIDNTLSAANMRLAEMDCLAVTNGPGSFTGIRIGVAAVKGMAFAAGKPCIGVSTLEAMAYGAEGLGGICCAVMDARRSQVYNALFSLDDGVRRLCADRAVSIDELTEELHKYSGTVWLCGDGAELCFNAMAEKIGNVRLMPVQLRYQSGYGAATAALKLADRGELKNCETLNPVYLRLSQAERELNNKNK